MMVSLSDESGGILSVEDQSEGDRDYFDIPKPKRGRIHEMILEDPISQLNPPKPLLFKPSDTVDKAVAKMRKYRFGSVVIVEDGRLAGIFTEHDLIRQFAGREDRISESKLSDVMTPAPQAIRSDDTLAHALNSMADGGYRHIPVVENNEPLGVVSIRGILSYLLDNALVEV